MNRYFLLPMFFSALSVAIPELPATVNLIEFLKQQRIINDRMAVKLHLGCGESHLGGYINIDYPLAEHTVQTRSGADVFADITQMKLPARAVDEVRSHHFFEHFDRQHTLALLTIWTRSLKVGGIMMIETPDFLQSIHVILSPRSYKEKQVTIRHIFGSHEAFWAMHYDGWYEEKFRNVLSLFGYQIISVQKGGSVLIPNVTVCAKKVSDLSLDELRQRSKTILRDSMVNSTAGEEKMWNVWCQAYEKYLAKVIA